MDTGRSWPVQAGHCTRLVYFFFQAEDGIRDVAVTGVQTCALPISPRVSLVSVSFSFATAPRSPALISGMLVWVFPCSSSRWPKRSAVSRVLLWQFESALSEPDPTRNIVMRPANGSAIVFHTKAAAGRFSSAARLLSPPSLVIGLNGRSAGEGR